MVDGMPDCINRARVTDHAGVFNVGLTEASYLCESRSRCWLQCASERTRCCYSS